MNPMRILVRLVVIVGVSLLIQLNRAQNVSGP